MATVTIRATDCKYSQNGTWATSSALCTGVTGSMTYRLYFKLDLSGIPSGSIVSSAKIKFSRTDTYTNTAEPNYIGIRTSAPGASFGKSDLNTVLNNGNYVSIARGSNSVSVSAAILNQYAGKAIYICMCPASSGYCYCEINKTLSTMYIEVTYEQGAVYYGTGGSWKKCLMYYGTGGSWVQVKPYYGTGGSWKDIGG